MPTRRVWIPGPKPGAPPWHPTAGNGYWEDVHYQTSAEREAGYRSAAAEAARVGDQSTWIASEASASELLDTVWTGGRARFFAGDVLRRAWVRLAASDGLPESNWVLARPRASVVRFLRSESQPPEQIGPIWQAGKLESSSQHAYLDSSGTLYAATATWYPSKLDGKLPVLVAMELRSSKPSGDTIVPVDDDSIMHTSVRWTRELVASAYVTAVCNALLLTLRTRP